MKKEIPCFASEKEAWKWLMEEVDDECVDNERLVYFDGSARWCSRNMKRLRRTAVAEAWIGLSRSMVALLTSAVTTGTKLSS